MSWDDAIKQFDGSNGWRLPIIEELKTLVDYSVQEPATELPEMVPSNYWLSTTHAHLSNLAWFVYFYNGYGSVSLKSSAYYVRAVHYL